jgi:predicted DNA-binding ribbon-helix-helix protein
MSPGTPFAGPREHPGGTVKSAITKRSVVIGGHKTSVSLEQPFWDVVREIAGAERTSVSAVLRRIDAAREQSNLSSAVRVFALEHVRALAAQLEPPEARAPSPMALSAAAPD